MFRNPLNLFQDADKDLHRTPKEESLENNDENPRNWRWSESPERNFKENNHKREDNDKSINKKRKRRGKSKSREDERDEKSRYSRNRKSRHSSNRSKSRSDNNSNEKRSHRRIETSYSND